MSQHLWSLVSYCLGRPRFHRGGEGLRMCQHCNRRHMQAHAPVAVAATGGEWWARAFIG